MVTKADLQALFDKRAAAERDYQSVSLQVHSNPELALDADIVKHRAWNAQWAADLEYRKALREYIDAENPSVLVQMRQP